MIEWVEEKGRVVARRGLVVVGMIFPTERERRTRWRVLFTKGGFPVADTAANRIEAKAEVERRFREFIDAAKLVPVDQLP